MANRGRKYLEALEKYDREKEYTPEEAVKVVKEIAFANFDETVSMHARLSIDPRHSDQQVRTTVTLPYGLGKEVRVLVFAEGEAVALAREAGADYIADDEIIERIKNGWFEFDAALAIPQMMREVGPLGRYLGRRGLMPNPKAGTIVQPEDLPRAIKQAKAGRIEFRNDKTANIHVPIGKKSFPEQNLLGNLAAVMETLRRVRPAAAKGRFIRRLTLSSSMSPGVHVDPSIAYEMEAPVE